MSRHAFRLSRLHRIALYGSLGLSLATGLAWWLLARFGQVRGEFGPAPNPAQPWLLRVHGAAAFAVLVVLGTLLPVHVKRAWRAAQNRASGGFLLSLAAAQVLTGYALYYSDDQLRERSSQLHVAFGFGLPALLILHIVVGRRSVGADPRRRSHRAASPGNGDAPP